MRNYRYAIAFLVAGMIGACDVPVDVPAANGHFPVAQEGIIASSWESELASVVKTLSGMLESGAARGVLHGALRESPFSEHKLVLQELFNTNRGRELLAQIEVESDREQFTAALQHIPFMDLYLPFQSHRKVWASSTPIRVGYTTHPNNSFALVSLPSGGWQHVTSIAAENEGPLLLLHPAEPKHYRIDRGDSYAGPAIEAPLASAIGGAYVQKAADGSIISVTELADLVAEGEFMVSLDCSSPEPLQPCDDQGSGGSMQQGVRLTYAYLHFGDGIGSAEVEWTLWDNNHLAPGHTVRVTGLDKNTPYNFAVPKLYWGDPYPYVSYPAGGYLQFGNLSVVETDAFSDDFWGYANVHSGSNGALVYTIGNCSQLGDPNTTYSPSCSYYPYTTVTTEVRFSW